MLMNILIFIGVVLLVMDLGQTLDIKNHSNLHEINPILGQHPSDTRVKIYFALAIIIFIAVAASLAAPLSYLWAGGWIGVEASTVKSNKKLGLKIF